MLNGKSDLAVGFVAAVAGSTGVGMAMLHEVADITAILLNIVIALGGLYLLYLRIKKAKKS